MYLRTTQDIVNFKMAFTRYGALWPDDTDPLQLEFECIRRGGTWENANGEKCGLGKLEHYLNARSMIWPNRYRHRWTELIYKEILQNRITILMGAASTQKSSHASEFVLISYWIYPENTAVLVSSTTRDKLDSAVYGEIKMLFKTGLEKHDWLSGHPLEYKQAILTDSLEDVDVRDFRKGIICKPCYVGRSYVGLGVFAGIKQERFFFLCDELQFMAPTFLDCLDNMSSNTGAGGLKVIGSGNPNHDPETQLAIAAEPIEGWQSVEDVTKTSVWDTKMYGGRCVNLIGTDSPNFDVAEGEPEPFPRLIGRQFEKIIAHDRGRNSPQYETQVMGRMRMSMAHSRVITRQLCRQHKAHDPVIWKGSTTTKIHACDPAYGGMDRCIHGHIEFGEDVNGVQTIKIHPPQLIKINVKLPEKPEDQIAEQIYSYLTAEGIPPNHSFYDAFGKGTIGFAFAKRFGATCPVPIDSGARPTSRPVRHDLFIYDEAKKQKRLKMCNEEYSKFVTEMWFSVRYIIECEQLKELPMDVMVEGCMREYYTVNGDKIEVEPKDKMRERLGRSPDLFDWLAYCCEGARQCGFKIQKLGVSYGPKDDPLSWLGKQAEKHRKLFRSKQLVHS